MNIVVEPEEKELAEQLATEYSRRTGVEMTLSSFVRHLIRQAALDTVDESRLKQHSTESQQRIVPLSSLSFVSAGTSTSLHYFFVRI